MAAMTSMTELRKMDLSDLLKELRQQQTHVAKLRLGVKMQKEKNHAKYKREKQQLARMQTVVTEKQLAAQATTAEMAEASPAQS